MHNEEEICPCCKLRFEYTDRLLDAESADEIDYLVEELIDKAMILGVKDAIITDVNSKMRALDEITMIEEDECDGNCDDCDCH